MIEKVAWFPEILWRGLEGVDWDRVEASDIF